MRVRLLLALALLGGALLALPGPGPGSGVWATSALSGPLDPHSGSTLHGSSWFRLYGEAERRLDWGGRYHRLVGATSAGRVVLHYVRTEAERYRLSPSLARGRIGAMAPLDGMVRPSGVAGINSSFFDPGTGLPVGFLLKDGRVLSAPYGERGTLAIGFFGRLHFLNPRFELVLRTPQGPISVDGVNRPALAGGIVAYTPEYAGPRGSWWGARVIAIRDGRVARVGSGSAFRAQPLEAGSTWLVAKGDARARIAELLPAERVQLDYRMDPERHLIRDAVQAGPLLLQGGRAVLSPEGFEQGFLRKATARSAVARTAAGDVILLMAEQGNGSAGIGLLELSQALRGIGAVDALALDGGGSSSLVFRDGFDLETRGNGREIPVGLLLERR